MILADYYNLYRDYANASKIDWINVNVNDLCRKYCSVVDSNGNAEPYLAAIICKYWNLLNSTYQQSKSFTEPEECYNWLLTTLQYELKMRPWDDENNSLYQDPKGPDKAIHKNIKCTRTNYIVASNRDKRLLNAYANKVSLSANDDEDDSKSIDIPVFDSHTWIEEDMVYHIVHYFFDLYDYLPAFVLDLIQDNNDCFDQGNFKLKKLKNLIVNMDNLYCKYFSERYNIPLDKCTHLAQIYSDCSAQLVYDNLTIAIDKLKCKLKNDKFL